MTDGFQKQAARSEDFEVVKIRRQGESLESCSEIVFAEYNSGDPGAWAKIPRMIDLGGRIGSGSYTDALTHGATSLYLLWGGQEIPLVTDFDGSNASYDKYTLSLKGFSSSAQSDISRSMAIDLDNSSAKKYGEYVADHTTVNNTPTTGYHYRYSFGTDGNLYITKSFLSGTLGKKLKLFYQTIGWGY